MANRVDFKEISTIGLESSPFKDTLAGLRASEARYFKTKYEIDFVTCAAAEKPSIVSYVENILKSERDLVIESKPLEVTQLSLPNHLWTYVFYESGLSINVLYALTNPKNRAVGFKLSYGMPIPSELSPFKFAKRKSTLAKEIRGSYFVIKKN